VRKRSSTERAAGRRVRGPASWSPSPPAPRSRPMAATPSSSGDPLQDHFERCLVQVLVGGEHSGTGFFVGPGKVLTCAHVVDPDRQVRVVWEEGRPASAQILRRLPEQGAGNPYPYPDLCLLQVPLQDHPCVRLDEQEPTLGPPRDHFRTAGFTEV